VIALLAGRIARGNVVRDAAESDGTLVLAVQHGLEFLPLRVAIFTRLADGLVYSCRLLRYAAKIVADSDAVGSWADLLHLLNLGGAAGKGGEASHDPQSDASVIHLAKLLYPVFGLVLFLSISFPQERPTTRVLTMSVRRQGAGGHPRGKPSLPTFSEGLGFFRSAGSFGPEKMGGTRDSHGINPAVRFELRAGALSEPRRDVLDPHRLLAVCLMALLLSSCSPPGPIPPKLAPPDASANAQADTDKDKGHHGNSKKASEAPAQAYITSENECSQQANKETMGSIFAMVLHLRPGAYTAHYVACMKTKGYDVTE
jgi:hypothetical protein